MESKTIRLWHGGRDLESSYQETNCAKGLWEHGPGLYLTTSYDRARKYAKGGGATYLVEIEEGNPISRIQCPIEDVEKFIQDNIIGKKRNPLLIDIHNNMKRMNSTTHIHIEHFLNLIINHEAIQKTKTDLLAKFLVSHGADYGVVKRYGGGEETVLVVFNRKKIKRVKKIKSNEIELTDYDLPFEFKAKNDLKIQKP